MGTIPAAVPQLVPQLENYGSVVEAAISALLETSPFTEKNNPCTLPIVIDTYSREPDGNQKVSRSFEAPRLSEHHAEPGPSLIVTATFRMTHGGPVFVVGRISVPPEDALEVGLRRISIVERSPETVSLPALSAPAMPALPADVARPMPKGRIVRIGAGS